MNKELYDLFEYETPKGINFNDKNVLCDKDVHVPFPVLEHLIMNDYKVNKNTFALAVEYNDIDSVDYLFYEGCPFDKYSSYEAAYNGCLRLLEMFHDFNFLRKDEKGIWIRCQVNQKHFIFGFDIIEEAKQGGCPDCIEFLQELLE